MSGNWGSGGWSDSITQWFSGTNGVSTVVCFLNFVLYSLTISTFLYPEPLQPYLPSQSLTPIPSLNVWPKSITWVLFMYLCFAFYKSICMCSLLGLAKVVTGKPASDTEIESLGTRGQELCCTVLGGRWRQMEGREGTFTKTSGRQSSCLCM